MVNPIRKDDFCQNNKSSIINYHPKKTETEEGHERHGLRRDRLLGFIRVGVQDDDECVSDEV